MICQITRAEYPLDGLPYCKQKREAIIYQFCTYHGIDCEMRPKKWDPTPYQAKPEKPKKRRFEQTDDFLRSYEWRKVRYIALQKNGRRCQCCGSSPETGATLNVDHIKPRKYYPDLALDVDNLQVLCGECNHGKGNWDMTDHR